MWLILCLWQLTNICKVFLIKKKGHNVLAQKCMKGFMTVAFLKNSVPDSALVMP
jgi:hypothetical protein